MPKSKNTFLDRFIENLMLGLPNTDFIADMVVPPLTTGRPAGQIAKMGDSHFRTPYSARARGGGGHRIDWVTASVPFRPEEHVYEHPVDDLDSAWDDDPYDRFRDAAFNLETMIRRVKERKVAALVRDTGNYPAGNVNATPLDWGGAGDPIKDVEDAKMLIIPQTGVSDSIMYGWCSRRVFGVLRQNAKIKEHYVNTTPGAANPSSLNRMQVAQALDLADLYVSNVVEDTSKVGGTPTMEFMWGDTEFGVYAKTPSPGLMVPNFGYQVFLRTEAGGNGQVRVDRYREEKIKSTIVRAQMMLDEIVTEQRLGAIFTSTHT